MGSNSKLSREVIYTTFFFTLVTVALYQP